jgi:hypothetical protein
MLVLVRYRFASPLLQPVTRAQRDGAGRPLPSQAHLLHEDRIAHFALKMWQAVSGRSNPTDDGLRGQKENPAQLWGPRGGEVVNCWGIDLPECIRHIFCIVKTGACHQRTGAQRKKNPAGCQLREPAEANLRRWDQRPPNSVVPLTRANVAEATVKTLLRYRTATIQNTARASPARPGQRRPRTATPSGAPPST